MKKLHLVVSGAILAVLGLAIGFSGVFAATGSIYLAPATVSVQKDSNVTVAVRINPGTNVDGVEANLTFDTTQLKFIGFNSAGTQFDAKLMEKVTGGTVNIARGNLSGGVSSDALVTQVIFQAVGSAGSINVNLTGNATSSGSYTSPNTSGATIKITVPTTPPPTTTPTTPPPTQDPAPSAPTSPAPSADPGTTNTPPTNTNGSDGSSSPGQAASSGSAVNVSSSDIQFTKAGIELKSEKPFKAYIVYGTNGQLNLQTAPTELGTKHTVVLDESKLQPGTSYQFKIISEDANGVRSESTAQTFKTKGYTLRITILGKSNKPLKKQQITLYSDPQKARTDNSGVALFDNVSPGTHTVEYEQDGKKYSQKVLVDNTVVTGGDGKQTAEPQNIAVLYDDLEVPATQNILILSSIFAGLLLIGALFILKKSGFVAQKKFASAHSVITTTTVSPPSSAPANVTEKPEDTAPIFQQQYQSLPQPGSTVNPVRNDNNEDK